MLASPLVDSAASLPRSVTNVEDELARLNQALTDLRACDASELVLVGCRSRTEEREFVDRMTRRARQQAFVTAAVSLGDFSLDTLEVLVRRFVENLVPPTRSGSSQRRGLFPLLDSFYSRHGEQSEDVFDERAERFGAGGELTALSRAYLTAEDPEQAAELIEAWLEGTELGRAGETALVRSALSARTARRALAELTHLVRTLGFAGTVLCLERGNTIAKRTPAQRDKAYTVLRELVDNFDSGRGAVATRTVITGTKQLFEGPTSLRSLAPLLSRLEVPAGAQPVPPHRSCVLVDAAEPRQKHRAVVLSARSKLATLRTLIRIAQGLPPTEAVASLSVGHERIDRTIDRLFEHSEMAGSSFTLLAGDYGTGKTHLMMHLAERALEDRHPVFWLSLERLDLDLGNPQRHLVRLLEHSVLPLRGRPSALDRVARWTQSPRQMRQLSAVLEEIAEEAGEDEAYAARRVLKSAKAAKDRGRALETFLSGRDLQSKSSGRNYRQDAYRRILLWIELLGRIDDCNGPVVLIDEAENLFAPGVSRAERRSALRSLAFYCGGALPSACVVIAMTPPALERLRKESRELFREIIDQESFVPAEDVVLFRRRLNKLEPEWVPEFSRSMRKELADRVRETHRAVRGAVDFPEFEQHAKKLSATALPPRALIRALTDQLESRWWGARDA